MKKKRKKEKKRSKVTNLILILAFFAGLSLLLYPSVSNYWNSKYATHAIVGYSEELAKLDGLTYQEVYDKALAYNEKIAARSDVFYLTDSERAEYESLLDITGTGAMGYIEIESLGVELPIYHGTEEKVLQVAVGHLDWTSLPVGGESSHCVLSGHRGLPSAKLFTDLNKLQEGETFELHILNEILTYEVDQIRTVLPEETDDLEIEKGKDYCTLVTCTPYGVNTHRLLVRGHRVASAEDIDSIVSEAVLIDPLVVAPFVSIPMLLLLMILIFTPKSKNKSKKQRRSEKDGGKAI